MELSESEVDERMRRRAIIENCGNLRYRVKVPFGSNKLVHHKAIRGNKSDAQRYVDWVTSLLACGDNVATISQGELRELQKLQAKADHYRAGLDASVRAGAKVEPGALSL